MRLNQINKIKIAHVGMSSDPHSVEQGIWGENDRWHMDAVLSWLYSETDDHKLLYHDGRDDDFIDLNNNRDFLSENESYDIVILHMIYSPSHPHHRMYDPGIFTVSTQHSPKNWRRRLISTGAKYIFTFGEDDEVSSTYLGSLSGYDGPIDAGNYLYVYVRV